MKDEGQKSVEEKEEKCEHEWEAIGEKYSGTHLEMKCKKCGKTERGRSFSMIHASGGRGVFKKLARYLF